MFAAEIRRAVEAAPSVRLPEIAALLWRAYGEGQVTEAEAETLTVLIEERKTAGKPPGASRKSVGSRPVSSASLERRRRWAASGRLPPALAARFTLAEQAVLALVAAEAVRRGDCRLAIGHVAAVAGVSRSTVKNAIREARTLGLVSVEERKLTGFRNLPNVVRIVSLEWQAWNRLARQSPAQRGGVKSSTRTPTDSSRPLNSEPSARSQRLPEGSGRRRRKLEPAIGGDGKVAWTDGAVTCGAAR